MRDLKSGLRQFLHKPLFSALAVLLLAIGIGANVLIFGFVDTLLLKPLPVRHPENLWLLESVRKQQLRPDISFSYSQFKELRKRTHLFSGVTAEQDWGGSSAYSCDESDGVRLVMTQMLAPNYFQELGVPALLGRVLTEADAAQSSNIPALISYQFWQSRYGGRADILGQVIRLKNFPFIIVGVLPRDFHSLDIERAPDVRVPISAAPYLQGRAVDDPRGEERRDGFRILVRLRPGVNPNAIEQAAGDSLRRLLEQDLLLLNASLTTPIRADFLEGEIQWIKQGRFTLAPAGNGISRLRGQFSQALNLLLSGVAVLLTSVCANVAGLLLARGEERRKELAVRLAVGAGHQRLLGQLMVENLCLALPGGVIGVALAYSLVPSLLSILPPVRSLDQYASPQILTVTPDLRTLLFAWLALLVSVCFFGLFPAWRATRLDLNADLKGAAAVAAHSLASLIPVTVQIALSVLLLAAGGLMLHSYAKLQNLNPGFDRAHVLSFTLGMKDARMTDAQTRSYIAELARRVRTLPGVRSVAYSSRGLMRGAGIKGIVTAPGVNQPAGVYLNTTWVDVTPEYFETLGIPLLAGRGFDPLDDQAKPTPVVINRALSDLLFPHSNPVGKQIVRGRDGSKPPDLQVVGLVETAKFRQMQEPAPPTFYYLLTDDDYQWVLYVRTEGNPLSAMRPIEDVIRKLGGGVPLVEASTLEQEVQNTLWQEKLVAALAAFFSFIALLLAGIGLYGTLAYSVSRRKRELGIRLAIGAQAGHIVRTVCGRMTWAVFVGLVSGLGLAAAALRLARGFLFEVDPLDKISFASAALAVLLCGGLAALIPSWRALRTDAAASLRDQ
jgi:predicted permease